MSVVVNNAWSDAGTISFADLWGSTATIETLTALQTYAGLQAAIVAWLNRADIAERVPDCITLAEADFRRQLVMPEMEASTTLFGQTAALPVDADSVRSVVGGTPARALDAIPYTAYVDLPALASGQPTHYATAADTIYVWPPQSGLMPLTVSYLAQLPALTDDNPTNWLLKGNPDVYLFGALVQAEFYGWNDERLPLIQAKLQATIDDINRAGQRKRYGGPLRMQVPVVENAGRGRYAFR